MAHAGIGRRPGKAGPHPVASLAWRDLASRLRRAASSVVLNLAEGSGSVGGMRTARYRTALGSAREALSCSQVAERFGYVEAMPAALVAGMNHVIGTLVRVAV